MTTITIFEALDEVYFLSNNRGFVKGWIKETLIRSESWKGEFGIMKRSLEKRYLVTCDFYGETYMGDNIPERLLFSNWDDMINYYKQNSPIK